MFKIEAQFRLQARQEITVKQIEEYLHKLCSIPSVSGFEDEFASTLLAILEDQADSVHRDILGNVIAFKEGSGENRRRLLFDAHIDQIGLMITAIEENGILRFTGIGGVNQQTLYGKRVHVHGRNRISGIIGTVPPHLLTGDGDGNRVEKMQELFIDAGFSSRREAESGVSIGDVALVDFESAVLMGDHFTGSGLDNKAGVAVLLSASLLISKMAHYHDIVFLFAVQEEVGLRGAKVGGFSVEPDAAVACDVTFAEPFDPTGSVKTGKGPVVGKGPNFYPPLVKRIDEIAVREDIPVQEEIDPRPGGTDADVLQTTKRGVYTAGVFIPLRYMHSQVEIINMRDVYRASKLLMHLSFEEHIPGGAD
jgi:endoglucanase